jgi:phage anti-repressor protein
MKLESIKIEGGGTIQFVNAAELYTNVGVKRPFALWFASDTNLIGQ